MNVLPNLQRLGRERVIQKLNKGRCPAQIAVWFASNAIAEVLNAYQQPLDNFIQELNTCFILEVHEKIELISFIRNNEKLQALDRLCSYLSRKSAEDIKQFQVLLQPRTPALADYLNAAITRCEEISRGQPVSSTANGGKCL